MKRERERERERESAMYLENRDGFGHSLATAVPILQQDHGLQEI